MKNLILFILILLTTCVKSQSQINPYQKGFEEFLNSRIEMKYIAINKLDTLYVSYVPAITSNLSKVFKYKDKTIPVKIISDKILEEGLVKDIFEINPIILKNNKLLFSISFLSVVVSEKKQVELIYTEGNTGVFELYNKRKKYLIRVVE